MKKTINIKKYNNRKYYDTSNATYIVCSDIKKMILKGYNVEVYVNGTKQNITSYVLFGIFLGFNTVIKTKLNKIFISEMIKKYDNIENYLIRKNKIENLEEAEEIQQTKHTENNTFFQEKTQNDRLPIGKMNEALNQNTINKEEK